MWLPSVVLGWSKLGDPLVSSAACRLLVLLPWHLGMAEFTEIGRHCAAENCNQQDFLPFKCDCCNGESERGALQHALLGLHGRGVLKLLAVDPSSCQNLHYYTQVFRRVRVNIQLALSAFFPRVLLSSAVNGAGHDTCHIR